MTNTNLTQIIETTNSNEFEEPIDSENEPEFYVPDSAINELLATIKTNGIALTGENGLLLQLSKRLIERALEEELTEHLGYDKGDYEGRNGGNSRNGSTPKQVQTEIGTVDLDVPRDRDSSFTPQIVPKGSTRLKKFNENIISLYAQGMSTRDIKKLLKRMYNVDVSPDLVSRVTSGVLEELKDWQARPLDSIYPILYIDALVVKVRTNGVVVNRAAYLGVGVDVDGHKHVLGIWLGDGGEGAKFWLSVLTELKNRGLEDVIFVCCDGLKGLPDAIEATWANAIIQTCVVHLIRASLRFCSYKDRAKIARSLRTIYTAPSLEAAEVAMDDFELEYGDKFPGIVQTWRSAWEQFIPFLAYPAIIRKIVYTTNMVESVNYQMRKASKTRGHFPDDDSALKLLRLIARDLSTTRGGDAGTNTPGWKDVLNVFEIHFPGRLKIC